MIDTISFLVIGLLVIIIGLCLQIACGFDMSFAYGWGCCDIFIGLMYRNYVLMETS